MAELRAVAGLGNPGPRYAQTRHNVGFWALERLAPENRWQDKFGCRYQKAQIASETCLLIEPLQYMNRSGECLVPLLNYFKIPLTDLVVMYDDLDLAPGAVRIRRGGSAGGHRGVEDILRHGSEPDFVRIKIGIGRPPERGQDAVSNWVLGSPSPEDLTRIREAVDAAVDCLPVLFRDGLEKAQQQFNRTKGSS